MHSKRVWQFTFLIAAGSLLLTSALAFGFSSALTFFGFVTIVIGVVNGLLSKPGAEGGNPVLSVLKNLLNVGPFLKVATVLVISIAVIFLCYGSFKRYSDYKESKKIDIKGLVLNAAGEPADKATVSLLLSKGSLQVVTSNGEFIFSKVDLSAESTKRIKLEAHLGSRHGSAEVDLSLGAPQNLQIKLSPGDPPFRVTYFLLEQQAIDFLIQGKVDEQWEARLAGQPFIIPNSVYQSLSRLMKGFSKPLGDYEPTFGFYKEEGGQKTEPQIAPSGQTIKEYFIGSADGGFVNIDSAALNLLRTLTGEGTQWKVFVDTDKQGGIPDNLVFRKFVTKQDLSLLSNEPVGRFYSHITQHHMPSDFGYLELYMYGECEDLPPRYVNAKYVGRKLSLRIAVVENVTNEPIRLGAFGIKENSDERLHTPEENRSALEKLELKHETLFPMEILKPAEKLVIPIEMIFAGDPEEVRDDLQIATDRQDLLNEIRVRRSLYFPILGTIDEPETGAKVSGSDLENILRRSQQMVTLEQDYLFGPSVKIESLEIDRVSFPFRQFDSSKVVIYRQTDTGSCPYVYTYSPEQNAWNNEGVILYGRTSAQKESLDDKPLSGFDGKLLIREVDPEDSFIDAIYVRAILPDGERVLYPRNRLLTAVDGHRMKLSQGEHVVLFFDVPEDLKAQSFRLGAVGYYVPYARNRNRISAPQRGGRIR